MSMRRGLQGRGDEKLSFIQQQQDLIFGNLLLISVFVIFGVICETIRHKTVLSGGFNTSNVYFNMGWKLFFVQQEGGTKKKEKQENFLT